MPHWRKFSTTENNNGYISLLLLYTGCTGCKRNICAPNFIITSRIYISSEASSIQHVSERRGQGWIHDKLPKLSWNSEWLRLCFCAGEAAAISKGAIKTWGRPHLNSPGQRPRNASGLPLWNSSSVRRWGWAQILKLSDCKFKAGSGSSTLLSAEQWNGPRSVILN